MAHPGDVTGNNLISWLAATQEAALDPDQPIIDRQSCAQPSGLLSPPLCPLSARAH